MVRDYEKVAGFVTIEKLIYTCLRRAKWNVEKAKELARRYTPKEDHDTVLAAFPNVMGRLTVDKEFAKDLERKYQNSVRVEKDQQQN